MKSLSISKGKQSDEIDLIDLVRVLWQKKLFIILSALIFATIAGIYAFTAKEKWTSTAEVISPRVSELGNYLALRKEYSLIVESEFDAGILAKELYEKFDRLIYSLDEREIFFTQSDEYKRLSENESEKTKREILFELMTENTSITKPDEKKDPNTIGKKISFTAESPDIAHKTLKEFINYVNAKAFKTDLDEFLIWLNQRINSLNYEKSLIERNVDIQKSVRIDNLSRAYGIAKEAGIKEYSTVLSGNGNNAPISNLMVSDAKVPLSDSQLSDGTYLFMLGEKYLKAQLDIVKNQPVIYPPRYYGIQEDLKKLEALLPKFKEAKAQTFIYQASPTYPVKRDWPKRVLLLLIGAVMGGMLGCVWVLLKQLFGK